MTRKVPTVIAGPDPAIHGPAHAGGGMDARVKPAHDNVRNGLNGTGRK
jgi:hypothetical protein